MECGLLGSPICETCLHALEFQPHERVIDGLSVYSCFYYQEGSILERLVRPFKYQHQAQIFRVFAPHLQKTLELHQFNPSELVLVPVPLHRSRYLERGYNQSELLAQYLSKTLGCAMLPLLKRKKDTGFQSHLHKKEDRRENMKDAFEFSAPSRSISKEYSVILVDDIVTSGSTLLACRDVLLKNGISRVLALTLADREKT